jgi:hypothetical protein
VSIPAPAHGSDDNEHLNRVLGGYKAALSSKPLPYFRAEQIFDIFPSDPNVGDEAKARAEVVLAAAGEL